MSRLLDRLPFGWRKSKHRAVARDPSNLVSSSTAASSTSSFVGKPRSVQGVSGTLKAPVDVQGSSALEVMSAVSPALPIIPVVSSSTAASSASSLIGNTRPMQEVPGTLKAPVDTQGPSVLGVVSSGTEVSTTDDSPVAQPTSAPSSDPTGLWGRAYKILSAKKEHEELLENYRRVMEDAMKEDDTGPKNKQATEDQVVPDILGKQKEMDYVVRKKLRVMQNKEWFVRWKGKPLFKVRDQVDRMVKVVQFMSGIASQAASLDPLHAGLAWAGVCVILPVRMILRFQVRWCDAPSFPSLPILGRIYTFSVHEF